MKSILSLSIDTEILKAAKTNIENISAFVEQKLKEEVAKCSMNMSSNLDATIVKKE